ncbi:methyl-accepting chemotaxis protein [Corallococcus sp. BB11-1]|uniref:methyl-accepting chemotaxis protein n=1 Tax=Corallococcus sp. BB11-1 TaxID=2996783 RepID=UPI00226D9254|nr:methyl-accepting chemotaxis protein [Corallococcus sp. BB11-1]MCY1032651.1 methyl-accepting chemotaxis protein [Corallococcus sp. BB11-1]
MGLSGVFSYVPTVFIVPFTSSRLAALGTALLLVLLSAPRVYAAPAHATVPAVDGWRFRWGDSPLGPDGIPVWATATGTEEGWRPVEALKRPPGRGTNTLLWLSIPVPEGKWVEPALYLGNVANAFEAYAGGQRIHVSGKVNPSGRESMDSLTWHLVPLPPEVTGQRILLRIQGTGPAIGVTQAARVGSHRELLAAATRTGLAPFVIGMLLLAIAGVSAGAVVLRRQKRMLVALTVFSGGSGALLLGMSGLFAALWELRVVSNQLTLLGAYCILPGLAWFISDTIGEGRMRWFRIGAAVVSVPAAIQGALLLVDLSVAQGLLPLMVFYSLPGIMVCVGVASVESWRGNSDARIFVAGLGVLFFFCVLTTLPMLGLSDATDSQLHWGFFSLTLSLVGIVGSRSSRVMRSLEKHTRGLEERRKEVRQLADSMGSGAGELAAVVQQLRATSEEQTHGISRQATALQQLEHTVEEIRQSSHVTADKARIMAASAETAEQVGRDGGEAVERTLTDLSAIRAEVSAMAGHILALDARTREIAGIVDVVKALADQSNMLALNAAIEAVRSGDSGKGFGVVAREMRSLADQSIHATQRIREVLDGVSASMREAAKASEQGEQRVSGSLDAVRTSGEQLQRLASIIKDTSSSVRQITAAVAQQDMGTHQIAQAIQELSGQMQRTLKVVDETQNVTHSVQSLAQRLSGVADQALRSGTLDAEEAPAG